MPITPSRTTTSAAPGVRADRPSDAPTSTGVLARFVAAAARAAARRPKLTIALWLALIVGCIAAGQVAGMRSLSNAASGTGESARADARLTAAGLRNESTEDVLVTSRSAALTA